MPGLCNLGTTIPTAAMIRCWKNGFQRSCRLSSPTRSRSHVEDVTKAVSALVTFVFCATGFVYAAFTGRAEGIGGYVDALYFPVTSLTTTGYGDVLLPGAWGRLVSIVIMLVGVTLFVRLGQSLLQPRKVKFVCPKCALSRHDPDAVHCKACGTTLCIPDEGS